MIKRIVPYLQRRKMDNTVDVWMGIEDLVKGSFIAHIDVVKIRSLSTYQFNAIECFLGRIVEVVYNHDLVVGLKQGKGGEGTNVAGPSVRRSASSPLRHEKDSTQL